MCLMYYVLASQSNGAFVAISSQELTPASDQVVLTFDSEIPGLSDYSWNATERIFERKPSRVISREFFESRFTEHETAAIKNLARKHIPSGIAYDLFKAAVCVDLDYFGLIFYLSWLVNSRILTHERVGEILA